MLGKGMKVEHWFIVKKPCTIVALCAKFTVFPSLNFQMQPYQKFVEKSLCCGTGKAGSPASGPAKCFAEALKACRADLVGFDVLGLGAFM